MDATTETLAAQVARLEEGNATLRRILAGERAERDTIVQATVERIAKEHARQWTGWLKRGEAARTKLMALCRRVEPLARVVAAWPTMGGNVASMPLMSAGGETITVGELQALVETWKSARGEEESAALVAAEVAAATAEASAEALRAALLQLLKASLDALVAGYEDHAAKGDPAPMPAWHQALERAHDHAGAVCASEPGQPVVSAVHGLLEAVQTAHRWRWQPGVRPPCAPSCRSWSNDAPASAHGAANCGCGLARVADAIGVLSELGMVPSSPPA